MNECTAKFRVKAINFSSSLDLHNESCINSGYHNKQLGRGEIIWPRSGRKNLLIRMKKLSRADDRSGVGVRHAVERQQREGALCITFVGRPVTSPHGHEISLSFCKRGSCDVSRSGKCFSTRSLREKFVIGRLNRT